MVFILIFTMHTYTLNGDLMYDPDITFTLDHEQKRLLPCTYEQSDMGVYQQVDLGNGSKDAKLERELGDFMKMWLNNIKEQGFEPAKAIVVDKENGDYENLFKR